MGVHAADQLRARARALRQLAGRVPVTEVGDALARADEDTWRGPLATACRDDLAAIRRSLDDAMVELRAAASWLDRRATEIEQAARPVPGVR
jgi:hypothetical protein